MGPPTQWLVVLGAPTCFASRFTANLYIHRASSRLIGGLGGWFGQGLPLLLHVSSSSAVLPLLEVFFYSSMGAHCSTAFLNYFRLPACETFPFESTTQLHHKLNFPAPPTPGLPPLPWSTHQSTPPCRPALRAASPPVAVGLLKRSRDRKADPQNPERVMTAPILSRRRFTGTPPIRMLVHMCTCHKYRLEF